MELFDAIASRSTAKSPDRTGPTPEQIARLLEAAGACAGPRASQALALRRGQRRCSGKLLPTQWRRRGATKIPTLRDEQMELEREKIRRSPCILVAGCVVQKGHPEGAGDRTGDRRRRGGRESVVGGAPNWGYGAMWKTGPAAYSAGVKAAVGLAPHDHIVAILHIGTRVS